MTTPDPGRESAERGRPVTGLAIAFIAIAAVLIAAHVHSLALSRPSGPDDSTYASEAARWLAGQPLSTMSGDPAAARPPMYVVVLAATTALSGDWRSAEPIIATLSVLVAVLAAAAIAWAIAGAGAAILSVIVFTVPGVADAFARSGIDGFQAALVLAATAVALLAGRNGSWSGRSAVAVGLGLGLAILTKETALALAPWPLVWAAGQPATSLRPALCWAGIASAILTLTILPWWLFVYQATGTLFLTSFEGFPGALGVGAVALAGLLPLVLVSGRVNGTVAGWIGRIGEPPRWWLAVVFAGIWAVLIVTAFLLADARYALPRLPSREDTVEAVSRLLALLLLPPATIAAAVVALAIAQRRPMLRGLVLVQLLTAGLVAIVVLKDWDPRSTLIPAIAVSLLLPIAAAEAARRMLERPAGRARQAWMTALMAVVVGVTSLNFVGLAQAAGVPPSTDSWSRPIVGEAADWLSARLKPGETVVVSWLFATSLDATTRARYRIVESPTLQLRVGGPGESILMPTGTLFRENAEVLSVPPDDWLFVRRHPDGYLVGLSAGLLADTIRSTGTRFLLLTGEHVAQSTATIAKSVALWPGVREVARFGVDDPEIVILEIDHDAFSVGPFDTQVNNGLLRDWADTVRRAGRGSDAGTALCELLGGRQIETVPVGDRGEALVERMLPAGCPASP